jgi:DNA-directed RNA polymerase specialized sigma24 family protein
MAIVRAVQGWDRERGASLYARVAQLIRWALVEFGRGALNPEGGLVLFSELWPCGGEESVADRGWERPQVNQEGDLEGDLEKALARLKPRHRRVVIALAVDGLWPQELAESRGTGVKTVSNRLGEATQALAARNQQG